MPATLTSITPNTGLAGAAVVLMGTAFNSEAEVFFQGFGQRKKANAAYVSATSMNATVPSFDGLGGALSVTVLNPGEDASNALTFTLKGEPEVEVVYPLVSLGQLKKFMGLEPDAESDDSKLLERINTASAQITGYTQRSFRLVTIIDELYDGDGSNLLRLKTTPIVTVTALSIDGQTVDVSEAKVYPEFIRFEDYTGDYNPRLRADSRVFTEGALNVKISYTGGYAKVPAEIAHATCLQVMHLENTVGKQGITNETNPVSGTSVAYLGTQLAPSVRVVANRFRRTRMSLAC